MTWFRLPTDWTTNLRGRVCLYHDQIVMDWFCLLAWCLMAWKAIYCCYKHLVCYTSYYNSSKYLSKKKLSPRVKSLLCQRTGFAFFTLNPQQFLSKFCQDKRSAAGWQGFLRLLAFMYLPGRLCHLFTAKSLFAVTVITAGVARPGWVLAATWVTGELDGNFRTMITSCWACSVNIKGLCRRRYCWVHTTRTQIHGKREHGEEKRQDKRRKIGLKHTRSNRSCSRKANAVIADRLMEITILGRKLFIYPINLRALLNTGCLYTDFASDHSRLN